MIALIRAAPNLRCIEIEDDIPYKYGDNETTIEIDVLKMLKAFKRLSTIEILRTVRSTYVVNWTTFGPDKVRATPFKAVISIARKVLLRSRTKEKKTLKVVTRTVPDFPERGRYRNSLELPADADEVVEILDLVGPS